MGRECGRARLSPFCNLRSRKPASSRASALKGGVFTSPFNQTSGLFSVRAMVPYVQYDINGRGLMRPATRRGRQLTATHERNVDSYPPITFHAYIQPLH